MKIFDLNIISETELKNRPVYVFRKTDRTGESRYVFVKHDGQRKTLTFNPTGDSNILFYTNGESAKASLQKLNDPSIKLSVVPIGQLEYLENKIAKKLDKNYILFIRTDQGDLDAGYQAIMPDGSYKYVVGKSKKTNRNKILKFNNPKDASYFARRYFRDKEVQIRPVEGSTAT